MPTTKNKKRMLATKNMEQSSQTSSPSLSESSEYREKKKKTRKKAKLDKRLKKLNKKIHVCGAVKDPQDLRDYVNDNDEQKQQKKFTLTDGSTDIGVTLFDDFAKQFEEAIKNIGSGNKFVIISSAKIGKFQGDVNLTNYPATRFYINPEHPAVKKLQKRAEKNNFLAEKEVIPTQLENVAIDDMSITDIKNLNKENSEVYEVCDVQINVDESVENATDVQQISEDAEDDQMLDEMHVETETSRNKAKKLPKKAQREKINAGGGKPKQQTSRNKEKIIKIKKEKNLSQEKTKVNANMQAKDVQKKKARKLIEVVSESEDEDMTLNSYQLKNKKYDVFGIIENDTPIADLVNRFGKKQKQVKFNIVDGRYSQGKFSKYNFVNHVKPKNETITVADVKKLPVEFVEDKKGFGNRSMVQVSLHIVLQNNRAEEWES
ncbi:hypothetical protein DCAR_0414527 [Daucus carota subsp. sativus]|uniref:Uncharacterized protein n=1 Tax=Daucus carota subsp. sativus TaxID=79200 RepID=A0A175YBW8_DAUCS|nr:hypothetical protein DCAR_0414527 [Daucus carota subsp. sativus]